MKVAYLFCRYYPLAIAPFHTWGLIGDHDQHLCESYYHVLYVCAMPAVRQLVLTVQSFLTIFDCRYYHHNVSTTKSTCFTSFFSHAMSPVILMLRTYAFSGRKKYVLALLSIAFFGLAGVIIWVTSKELYRLSRKHFFHRGLIPDTLVESQCRPCSFSSILAAVLPFRIHRARVNYWRRRPVH